MSTTVDNRVVEMRFDNSNFESNVKESMSTLERLKQALKFNEGTKGLDQISAAAKNVKLDGIESGVESLRNKFSVLGVAGMSVINNLTNSAINLGKKLYSNTVGQVVQGGWNRAANIEKARFTLQGVLKDGQMVDKVMTQAMDSVDGTAYGFDQAALAASQFASSGVKAGTQLENALAAVAGTAATTGSEYSSIAHVFTRVAGQGRVMATDLNSLATSGVNAAVEIANFMNGVNNGSIKASDSVKKAVSDISKSTKLTESDIRDFVSKGKIQFDIFSEAMNNAFGEHAKDANKTFTGALDNVKARLKQIGQKFFVNYNDSGPLGILNENSPVVLFLNDLRVALTGVRDAIDPLAYSFRDIINIIAEAGSGFLKFFDTSEKTADGVLKDKEALEQARKAGEMFKNIVYGITNLLNGFWGILQKVGEAFTAAFPSVNIDTLVRLSRAWVDFTGSLAGNLALMTGVKNTFTSLFAIVRIFGTVLKNIWYVIKPIVSLIPWLSGGILGLTGSLSDQLVALSESFAKWDGLKNVMSKVSNETKKFANAIDATFKHIEKYFDGLLLYFGESGGGIIGFFAMIAGAVAQAAEAVVFFFGSLLGKDVSGVIDKIWASFRKVRDIVESMETPLKSLSSFISKVFSNIKSVVSNIDFSSGFDSLKNAGQMVLNIFSRIKQGVKDFLTSFKFAENGVSGFGDSVKSIAQAIATVLGAIAEAAAKLISALDFTKVIASGGIGVLVAWMYKLYRGTLLVTSTFKEYLGVLGKKAEDAHKFTDLISAFSEVLYSIQLKLKAEALRSIAISIAILAASLFVLSTVEPSKLESAAIAIGELFAMLIGSMKLIEKFNIAKVDVAIGSLLGISAAVFILASAVKKLAKLDPAGVTTGVLALAGIMGTLLVFVQRLPERKLTGIAGPLILISIAVRLLAGAVKKLGSLDLATLAKGLGAVVLTMAAFAGFTHIVKERELKGLGTALITLAIGMRIMASAVSAMGGLDIASWGKGLGAIVIVMAAFAGFTRIVKEGKFIGIAISMTIMAAAMLVLQKAVAAFGSMEWEALGKGAASLAGALILFAGFSRAVSPSKLIGGAIGFAALSGALIVLSYALDRLTEFSWGELGRGLAVVAASLVSFGLFSKLISPGKLIASAIGIGIMSAAMTLMAGVVVKLASLSWDGMVRGLVGFGAALIMVGAAATLMNGSILGAVSLVVMAAAMNLLVIPIEKLAKIKMGALVKALIGLAAGLAIIGVAGAALGIVSPLIFAFGVALTAVGAGIALVGVGFMAVATAISILATAMANGATTIMMGIMTIAVALPAVGTKMGEAILNMVTTILNGADQIIAGVTNVANQLLTALGTLIPKVSNLAAQLILSILTTINSYLPAIIQVAGDIITNFLYGMAIQMPRIITAATYLMIMLVQGIAQNLPVIFNAGIQIVWNLVQGLFGGVAGLIGQVIQLFSNLGTSILNAIRSVLGINSPSTEFYDIGSYSIEGIMQAINEKGSQPADGMSQVGTNMLASLQGSASSGDFQAVGSSWLSGLTAGLNSGETASSGQKAAGDAAQGAAEFTGEFNLAGNDLMSEMVAGLDSQAPNAATSAANAAKQGAQAVRPYQGQWVSAGRYLMLGLVKGIREKAPDAARAAAAAGKAAVTALQTAIQQGSPSKLTYQSGVFFGEGFVNGMKALTYSVGSVAGKLGDKAISELTSAVTRISALVDDISTSSWNPKITPVVDLANVSGSLSAIDGMLTSSQAVKLAGSANISMTDNTTELQDYGVRVNNVDVVKAITALSDDIEDLQDAMRNLKVYMDTGALVGEIRDPIDKALGVKANRQARGG